MDETHAVPYETLGTAFDYFRPSNDVAITLASSDGVFRDAVVACTTWWQEQGVLGRHRWVLSDQTSLALLRRSQEFDGERDVKLAAITTDRDLRKLRRYRMGCLDLEGCSRLTDEFASHLDRVEVNGLRLGYSNLSGACTIKMGFLKTLQSLTITARTAIKSATKVLGTLPLTSLTVESDVDDLFLAQAGKMKRTLTSLTLRGLKTRATDAGMASLQKLANLVELVIEFESTSPITTEGVAAVVSASTMLRKLRLFSSILNFDGALVAAIKGQADLKELSLECISNRERNSLLGVFGPPRSLRRLDLKACDLSAANFDELRSFSTLTSLRVTACAGWNAEVALAVLPSLVGSLETVDVDEGWEHALTAAGSKVTSITGNRASGELVAPGVMQRLKGLELLGHLPGDQIDKIASTGSQLQRLEIGVSSPFEFTSLSRSLSSIALYSASVDDLTDATLVSIGRNLPLLCRLELEGGTLSDDGLEALTKLRFLDKLRLTKYTELTDEAGNAIVKIPSLTELDVDLPSITSNFVGAIAGKLPELRVLKMFGCVSLDETSFLHIPKFQALERFDGDGTFTPGFDWSLFSNFGKVPTCYLVRWQKTIGRASEVSSAAYQFLGPHVDFEVPCL